MRSRIGLYSSSPQPSRHGEQNTRDGEKRRAGKPADAVRQDVEDDGEADDRRGEQQRGQSEQEARRKYFLARVTKQEQPIAFQNLVHASTNSKVNRCTVQREINRQYNCCQIEPNEKAYDH